MTKTKDLKHLEQWHKLKIRVHFADADGSPICRAEISQSNRVTTVLRELTCNTCRRKIGFNPIRRGRNT